MNRDTNTYKGGPIAEGDVIYYKNANGTEVRMTVKKLEHDHVEGVLGSGVHAGKTGVAWRDQITLHYPAKVK